MSNRRLSRRALVALTLFGVGCLIAAGCSGDDDGGTPSTTAGTGVGVTVPTFSDASVPVEVPVGQRFVIMLPADPAHGWRWVVDGVDTDKLAPLGSEFRDDPALLAQATTTTAPPPPETTGPEPGGSTTESTTTTVVETTPTTTPGPLVQLLSFAGTRIDGTTLTLVYEPVVPGDADPADFPRVTFNVWIGGFQPPAPSSETTLPD